MFLAHYGIGLAANTANTRVSLGTWFLAVQWLDLIWPIFLLTGLEHVRVAPQARPFLSLDFTDYPLSHSLLAALAWGVLFGAVYFVVRRRARAAVLLGAGVISHWALDFIVHRPDLPLAPGGPKVGLGLWNNPVATTVLEVLLYGLGIFLYLRATRPKDATGRYGLLALLALLVLIFLSNFGPPPPDAAAVAWFGLLGWAAVAWAYWVDAHREPARPTTP